MITILISIVGFFLNRHFKDFDSFKVEMHNRFNQISNEVAQFKKEIELTLSLNRTNTHDFEARKNSNSAIDQLAKLKEEVGQLNVKITNDKVMTEELIKLIRAYKEKKSG